MKTNIYFKNELRLIAILCRLAIMQTQLPIFSFGLKDLLNSKAWRESSVQQKLSLLDQQYSLDFKIANSDQKKLMSMVRAKIKSETSTT